MDPIRKRAHGSTCWHVNTLPRSHVFCLLFKIALLVSIYNPFVSSYAVVKTPKVCLWDSTQVHFREIPAFSCDENGMLLPLKSSGIRTWTCLPNAIIAALKELTKAPSSPLSPPKRFAESK